MTTAFLIKGELMKQDPEKQNNTTANSTTANNTTGIEEVGDGINDNEYLTFIHNIVFGLVTSVVSNFHAAKAMDMNIDISSLTFYLILMYTSRSYKN